MIIIANMRSGSTFLVSCLNSHSKIKAFDGEPLWERQGDPVSILEDYYRDFDVAKITYIQVNDDILDFVSSRGMKIVHLTREDPVHWAFSAAINEYTNDIRYKHFHSGMERPEMPRFAVDVSKFMDDVDACARNQRRMRNRLEGLPNEVYHITYEEITGGHNVSGIAEDVARPLCEFLDVSYEPLTSDRRKSAIWPMEEVITNWSELK